MDSPTYRRQIGCGKLYLTVFNEDDNKFPSVIIRLGKAGTCANAQIQSIYQLINLALSLGATFEQVVECIKDISCVAPTKEGKSCGDGVARILKDHIKMLKASKKE